MTDVTELVDRLRIAFKWKHEGVEYHRSEAIHLEATASLRHLCPRN